MTKWLIALASALCCVFAARGILHYFQLESYQFPGFRRSVFRNRKHSLLPGILAVAGLLLILLFCSLINQNEKVIRWYTAIVLVVCGAAWGLLIQKWFNDAHAKKKFVITGRIKRLYVVLAIVLLLGARLSTEFLNGWGTVIWPALLPAIVALAGLLAWPVEKLISEMYFRDARRRLMADHDLIRIGITGSYGKTTVKHILGSMLSEKYPTLITPASFNTPMGVTRAIREHLTPSHQIFIGEMGARHVGDIKELCRLVHPTIGLITSVGPQHLETFKTMDRIVSTKYELIDALPETGSHAYFPDDGSYCLEMYRRTSKEKSLCGVGPGDYDCRCDDIRLTQEGSCFTLYFKNGESVECTTRLLGKHNLRNIALAACAAHDLGVNVKQIRAGIAKLQPVKARLELISRPGSFTVINDAFNSNPVGAAAALEVLKSFRGRRIIITPGMVELGAREAEYNHDFGKQIASSADIAIIVGKKRVQPILDGILEAGFPKENLFRVDDLETSTVCLHKLAKPDDIVLYENDLPDHYQEA